MVHGLSGFTTAQCSYCRGRTRDPPPVRQAHHSGCLGRPPYEAPGGLAREAARGDRGALGDRTQTKTRSALGEPGLGATTRLRQGELRFRRGQSANVHRSNVAGGGPFDAARCRDRFAHLLPQETSAGRNLITVFVHVNNPAQFFSTRLPAPRSMRARGGVPMRRVRRRLIGVALARLIRKLHEKRHLAKTICMTRTRACTARHHARRPVSDHFGTWHADSRRCLAGTRFRVAQVDLRENCASLGGRAENDSSPRQHRHRCRRQEKTRAVAGAGSCAAGEAASCRDRRVTLISDPRPRAARRNRPGPAVRSTARRPPVRP